MEIRQLGYFVAVAEAHHFGRAAKVLFISQPSLSYAIKSLEQSLGVQLFHRHARGVDLTEAGADLLPTAKAILSQVRWMEDIAERHRVGGAGRLRIGFQASAAGRLSTMARAEFQRLHPDVRLEPRSFGWRHEVTALREEAVDVAFVWLPADTDGLHLEVIAEETRMCALSKQHPLSGRESLSIMDLVDEPFMRSKTAPQSWLDWWVVNPRPDGSEPVWWPRTAENTEELLEQVAEGGCVATVAASVATYYPRPDLAFIPIVDIEPVRIALGWREGDDSPLVASFAEVVRQLVVDGVTPDGTPTP
ncbi:MAG TPA: LysR family transcriptional regulator [Conexibacter sp.]|nr:LysR family transcriptional regulator [Conexibacter sp.]